VTRRIPAGGRSRTSPSATTSVAPRAARREAVSVDFAPGAVIAAAERRFMRDGVAGKRPRTPHRPGAPNPTA
jgi:hypothetical protein